MIILRFPFRKTFLLSALYKRLYPTCTKANVIQGRFHFEVLFMKMNACGGVCALVVVNMSSFKTRPPSYLF